MVLFGVSDADIQATLGAWSAEMAERTRMASLAPESRAASPPPTRWLPSVPKPFMPSRLTCAVIAVRRFAQIPARTQAQSLDWRGGTPRRQSAESDEVLPADDGATMGTCKMVDDPMPDRYLLSGGVAGLRDRLFDHAHACAGNTNARW